MSAFLTDGVVNLRPVTRADLPQLAAWRNDPELRARTREFRPLTDVDQERWLERISGPDRRDFMFVVERCVGVARPTAIGVVGLCHADGVSAEVSFYIGDSAARRQGFTKRALALLQTWGFSELRPRLHRIWAECYDFNEAGQRTLVALGYRYQGSMRDVVFWGGQWRAGKLYDLLEDEWRARS